MKTDNHPDSKENRYKARVQSIVNMIETTLRIHAHEVPNDQALGPEKVGAIRKDVMEKLGYVKQKSKGQ